MPRASVLHLATPDPSRSKGSTDLGWPILVRKDEAKDCGRGKQIFNLESIEIGILGGLVVMKHQVYDVARGADEDQFEDGVVEVTRVESCPEEVCRKSRSAILV